jgi:hypothetical protein
MGGRNQNSTREEWRLVGGREKNIMIWIRKWKKTWQGEDFRYTIHDTRLALSSIFSAKFT